MGKSNDSKSNQLFVEQHKYPLVSSRQQLPKLGAKDVFVTYLGWTVTPYFLRRQGIGRNSRSSHKKIGPRKK
jgi:hypothetical protein